MSIGIIQNVFQLELKLLDAHEGLGYIDSYQCHGLLLKLNYHPSTKIKKFLNAYVFWWEHKKMFP